MKLSKAQQMVLDKAKADIDFARNSSYAEWVQKTMRGMRQNYIDRCIEDGEYLRDYEAQKNGRAIVYCNSKTLYKLAEYGLIEIIEDSNGETQGLDVIKVLNY